MSEEQVKKEYKQPKRRNLTSQDILDRQQKDLMKAKRRLLLEPPLGVSRVTEGSPLIVFRREEELFVTASDAPEHQKDGWGVDYYTKDNVVGFAKWNDDKCQWEDEPY